MKFPSIVVLALPFAFSAAAPPLLEQEEQPQWTQEELEEVTRRIQTEVEVIREAKFEREVTVRITDKKGFFKHANDRMDEMVGPEELAAEQDVARLLGLIPPDMDLLAITMDVLEDQVGGFYDPSNETFYLMENFTGGIAEVILSHELTHALDDQLFDIDGTLEPLLSDRDSTNAYQAVVEGSGTLVMALWTAAHADKIDPKALAEIASLGAESLGAAPPYVWKPMFAAYMKGQMFLMYGQTLADGGTQSPAEAIDQAFANPPTSTEQILHPEKYWNEKTRDEPREIVLKIAPLPDDWKQLDQSTLGELFLALLADKGDGIDLTNPMAVYSVIYTGKATTGWGGDRMVLLGSGDARFLRVVTLWDSQRDAEQFAKMLRKRLPAWEGDLGQLDSESSGSGVRIDSAPEEESPRVTFDAWFGVDGETLEVLGGRLGFREVAEK
jgi:hypothetical protein